MGCREGHLASEDGDYHSALSSSTTFSKDSATYADAQTAYYVAYQQYAQKSQGPVPPGGLRQQPVRQRGRVALRAVYLTPTYPWGIDPSQTGTINAVAARCGVFVCARE